VPRVKGLEPERELRVIDARDIPRIDDNTKVDMLRIFAEGYFMAETELAGRSAAPSEDRERRDPKQRDLFDDDPPSP
jgi:hypothetical protein